MSFTFGASINQGIDKQFYLSALVYPSVETFVAMVISVRVGVHMYKSDLCKIHRECQWIWEDLGYNWKDKIYFKSVLPIGLLSAALKQNSL